MAIAGAFSETRTFDDLLTTTLDNYRPTLFDNVFKSTPFYAKMYSNGRIRREDGGASIIIPLMLAKNSTVAWYEGYDTIDVTPQEGLSVAKYPWCELSGSVTVSRREERLNSGRHRLINLVDTKIRQLELSLIDNFSSCLFDSGGGKYNESQATKQMASLQAMVAEVPTSYSVGGISASTVSVWKNKAIGDSGTAFTWVPDLGDTPAKATGPAAMSRLYNCCSKGEGGGPDLGVCSKYMYEEYESGLHVQKRFTNEGSAAAGFDNLRFRRLDLFWDEYIATASVASTATEAAGGICAYFLNTEFLEIIVDAESDFVRTPWVQPENQTARTMLIIWMGNLVTSNRRKHGVLTDGNITDIT